MAGRRPEAEYRLTLEEARACVERLFRELEAPVSPLLVQNSMGWQRGATHERLANAAKRGLLRHHEHINAYSPAVDAEGRPVRLALVPDEEPQGEPKSA